MMSLVTLFGGLKSLFKVRQYSADNFIFRLHYKLTTGLFLAGCLLITAVQLVTDPITCDVKGVSGGIFNAFCWSHATFTLPHPLVNDQMIHPGVGPDPGHEDGGGHGDDQDRVYHGWYQWVGMALFGQSFTFYIGHFLWKSCEGRRVERLVSGIISPVASEDVRQKHCTAIGQYFYHNHRRNGIYGVRFIICEFINIANAILQIYLIDSLLGGEFSSYGFKVLSFVLLDDEERNDPMIKVFPKVTKCTFHNFGVSGSIQKFDGLCILPINMINDKIYVILWFWLVLLLMVSIIHFVFRIVTVFSTRTRMFFLINFAPNIPAQTAEYLQNMLSFGDWLLLTMMADHIDIKLFSDILKEIKKVNVEEKRRSSISTTIDVVGASDSEDGGDNEDKDLLKVTPIVTPVSPRRLHPPIIKKTSTATNLVKELGMDHGIIKEMLADGYDPTQVREWERFRQMTMGDSSMLAAKDKVEEWRNRGDSFGQRFGNLHSKLHVNY